MNYSTLTDYSNKIIDGKPAIWLQGVGWAPAKPAKDFKVGEYNMWNTGGLSKIVDTVKETPKFITYKVAWIDYNNKPQHGERRLKKDRWVAIGTPHAALNEHKLLMEV